MEIKGKSQNWQRSVMRLDNAILIVLKFSLDRLEDGRVVTEFQFWPPPEIGESVRRLL